MEKCQFTSDHLVLIAISSISFWRFVKTFYKVYFQTLWHETCRGEEWTVGNHDNTDTVKDDISKIVIKEAGHYFRFLSTSFALPIMIEKPLTLVCVRVYEWVQLCSHKIHVSAGSSNH